MINTLVSLYMVKKAGVNICKGICYNYLAKNFKLDEFLDKYEEDLNKGVRTLSLVEPSFVDKEIIEPCYQVLKENVTESELINVTNRINSIRVKKGLFSLTNGGTFNNALNLIKYYNKKSLMHEFLHMASSYYDKEKKVLLCGFEKTYKMLKIGLGLTEGFTELFAARFEKRDVHSYRKLTEICEMLEILFDNKDDVRKMYFSCDLPSFINKLREYMSDEEIFNLIREMDFLTVSNEMNRAHNIKLFIYKRFMEKCHDGEKITRMDELISKHNESKIFSEACKPEIRSRNIEDKNSYQHFKFYSKKSIAKAATTVAICTSLLIGNSTLFPASLKETQELVNAHMSDNCSVMFSDEYSLSSEKSDNSLSGYDLYRSLIHSNIKYFEVDGEYYTKDGGELSIEECQITIREYVKDAIPIYHNGVVIDYAMGANADNNEYEIIDGKVYHISYMTYNRCILSDGKIYSPASDIVKDINGDISIAVIDSYTVQSKSYEELKNLYLAYGDNIQNENEYKTEGRSK